MKSFFFTFITIIIVIGLGVGGYFAFESMTSPASYIPTTPVETIGDLHSIVTDPDTGNPASQTVTSAVATSQSGTLAVSPPSSGTSTTSSSDSASTTLSSEISAMISNNISVKLGDENTNVGYVEQFMNLYFNKNSAIDNSFGKGLQANVETFQKQNKVSQTGTVGTSTLQMMVLWLKNNPQ